MRLSNQALGALMMALQKSLLEQSDITHVLREFNFQLSDQEELLILNPPTVKIDEMSLPVETKSTTGSD